MSIRSSYKKFLTFTNIFYEFLVLSYKSKFLCYNTTRKLFERGKILDILLAPVIILIALIIVCIYSAVRASKLSWQCNKCGKVTNPALLPLLFAPQSKGHKYMRCPACNKKAYLKPVAKQK
jgi:Mitotic inducer, protein phosphatase